MIPIYGPWIQGYSYDQHTISSNLIGHDEYGRPMFDTQRTDIGNFVHQLKYCHDNNVIPKIINLLNNDSAFISLIKEIDYIIPIPPSNKERLSQPVFVVAKEIASKFKITFHNIIESSNNIQIKNITNKDEKRKLLEKSITIKTNNLDKSKKILLFDDIFDSGDTLTIATKILNNKGFKNIVVFTLTKTRIPD